MADEITFEHNGATYAVRRETVRDRLAVDVMQIKLAPEVPAYYTNLLVRTFATFAISTTLQDGESNLLFVDERDDPEKMLEALETWLAHDATLVNEWEEAYADANAPKAPTAPATDSER
jgi:hypothetical protein